VTLLHRFAPRLGRWWPQSLVGRVYVLYSVTLLLFVGVGLGLFYRYIEEQELQSVQQAADIMVNVAAQTVGDSAVIGDYDTIQRTLNKAVQHPYFASASFIDLGGAVLRSSNTPDTSLSAPAWLLQHLGEHLYEVNHVINVGGRDYGVLRIQFATEAIVGNLWALLRSALWLALAGLTGGLLLIHRPLKRWLGALDRAREFGQQAAQGQHSQVEQHIADMPPEFRPLFQVLSDTASSLRTELHTRENALQSLRHTLAGLQDLPGAATLENNNDLTKLTNTLNQLVTEREASRKVVERALDAAEAASRIKSEFLANMSHEIRTPMNAVLGLAQLLLDMELAPKQRDYLHKIHQAATTLLGVLNDILDYSKIEAGYLRVEMVPMRLDEVLRNSVTLFEARATEKQLQLDWHIEPQVPLLLEGDPLRLGQVLNNLIGNAIKFTARGSVQVVVSCAQTLPQAVLLKVVVRDTGIGLTAEQISGIFEAFQQADASTTRKYGGTGLGLSISKRLVELMGGEMGVDSEAGQGSRFWFTVRLGVCAPSLLVPTGASPDSAELPGGTAPAWTEVVATTAPIRGARVLLVDDNATNRLVASEYLNKMGLLVQQAYNGISAVEMATQQPFDAILMDLHMNGMDGFAAARAIRAHPAGQHVPIIALSAAALQRDVAASQAAGMNAHLPKPINALQLARALVQWIAPRSTIAPLAEPQPLADGAAVVAPFQLPGLDLVRAQPALDHDWARLRRVLLSFYRDCVTLPAALDEALQHQQWGDAVRYVHSVKGLAPVVGATALQQMAQRLEAELQQQQAHTYPDFVRLLQQALTAIAPLVQADARTDATPAPSAAPLRAIALDELLTRLCALQPLLASGQVKACGLSTEIALLVAGTEWQQPYAPVAQAIERLDFKAARQHLHNLAHAQHWSLS